MTVHEPTSALPAPGRRRRLIASAAKATAAITAGILAATASPALAATTEYVSASASTDPACASASQANPFATIAGALKCATSGATINIGPGTFPGVVTVPTNVTLIGSGAATVIEGSTDVQNSAPAIRIPDGRSVAIKNLTIDGIDQTWQGIVAGGGSLTVANVTIKNTGSRGFGAAIEVKPTAGRASVTVTNSTLNDNISDNGGGGIYVSSATTTPSTLSLTNSTLTGNDGRAGRGGALLVGTATATLRDDTIFGNQADFSGGGIAKDIFPGTVSITDTIVATNGDTAQSDCDVPAAKLTDAGHNLIGAGCGSMADTVNGDRVGTPSSPINPVLGDLANNGGPTETLAPLLGSPAINAGDASDCVKAGVSGLDQRHVARQATARLLCDIGAVDTGGTPVQTLYVKVTAPSDPTCDAASAANPFKTLAAALACADNGTMIKIGAGTYSGQVSIAHDVVLTGVGPTTIIAGSTNTATAGPDLTIAPDHEVVLQRLTADGRNQAGPGVVAGSGRLTLINTTILRGGSFGSNRVYAGGLSVSPAAGAATETTLYDSTIDHNVSDGFGGGILVKPDTSGSSAPVSTLSVLNSTVASNSAPSFDGGGIWFGNVRLTLRDSTIAGNSASNAGGGIRGSGDAGISITNTILARNKAFHGPDCSSLNPNPLPSGGHNVIGQIGTDSGAGCQALADNGTAGDQVGTTASPLDPKLSPLGSNGGLTRTMATLAGSPARGGGSATDSAASPISGRDQRGVSRQTASRGVSDVGAYDTGGSA